jgi:hypothetical protein
VLNLSYITPIVGTFSLLAFGCALYVVIHTYNTYNVSHILMCGTCASICIS